MGISTIRVAQVDLRQQPDYTGSIINIEDVPRIDSWSPEGVALSRFDRKRAEASAAAAREREALEALTTVKHTLRRRYGPFGTFRRGSPQANREELKRPEELETSYDDASSHRIDATRAVQYARAEFDLLCPSKGT